MKLLLRDLLGDTNGDRCEFHRFANRFRVGGDYWNLRGDRILTNRSKRMLFSSWFDLVYAEKAITPFDCHSGINQAFSELR
jgi:hypothetical protein